MYTIDFGDLPCLTRFLWVFFHQQLTNFSLALINKQFAIKKDGLAILFLFNTAQV